MGLLDDAIREHLDLKRRRGADPAEIERAEREALGPVRREPVAAVFADEPAVQAEPVAAPEYEDAAAPERGHRRRGLLRRSRRERDHDDFVAEYVADEPAGLEPDAADHHDPFATTSLEPAPAPEADERSAPDPAVPPVSASPPPVGASPPPVGVSPPPVGAQMPPAPLPSPEDYSGQTVEYDVESAFPDAQPERGDVLEETPEFLQDTPDHDRLWFEQRPPRDFDFDG